jgi:hypothetical protein
VKKIIAGVVGALLVVAAGVGLWFFLDSASPAATVGKTKISASQVSDSVKAVIAERSAVSTAGMQLSTVADLPTQELNLYVISALYKATAAANNIVATPAQVAAEQALVTKQLGSAAALKSKLVSLEIASKDFPLFMQTYLLNQDLTALVVKKGTAAANAGSAVGLLVSAQATKDGVTVAKKYGTWDAAQLSVVPPTATK